MNNRCILERILLLVIGLLIMVFALSVTPYWSSFYVVKESYKDQGIINKHSYRNQPMNVQRVFDVRKLCDRICDRTMKTCFVPETTVFIYENISAKDMVFEQTFNRWRSNKEGFSHKRKLCSVREFGSTFKTMTMRETCAVIGNGGIILSSGCGEEIDSHDCVLRANMAETDGYSEDVGSKTTLMMVNVQMTDKIFRVLSQHNGTAHDSMEQIFRSLNESIFWYGKALSHGSKYSKQMRYIAVHLEKNSFKTQFAFSYASAGEVAKRKWKTRKYPSSGLIMLTVAETFCRNISLYGFYPYEKSPSGKTLLHHYYDPKIVHFSTPVHDFDGEHKLLKSLHKKGRIRLVIDQCDKKKVTKS